MIVVNKGMGRIKVSELLSIVYIWLLTIWSFFNILIYMTTLDGSLRDTCSYVLSIVESFILIHAMFSILWKLRKRDIIFVLALFFAVINQKFTGNTDVTTIMLLLCGSKSLVNLDKIISPLFWSNLLGIGTIVSLSSLGIIENSVRYRRDIGLVRYSMGFYHPNTFASRVFQLMALYLLFRKNRLRIIDVCIMIPLTIWTYMKTNSKTGLIMMTSLIIVAIFIITQRKVNDSGKNLFVYITEKVKNIVIIIPVISIILGICGEYFFKFFSGTLLARVSQISVYLDTYKLNLIGHRLELNYHMEGTNLYTLDNAYIYLLLTAGVIFFVLYIVLDIKLIKKLFEQKRYVLLLITVLYSVYGFSETVLIRLSFNFTLLYLSEIIWDKENLSN